MTIIPCAEWAPDMPDLSDTTDVASNVIARTPESYGPFSGLSAYSSNALDGQCIGMLSVQDTDSSVYLFAGSSDKLYEMTGASNAWSDVSKSGGYTTAQGDAWRFAQFKRIILATNFGDAIQAFTMGSSTAFADLSSGAPKARHIAVAKNFAIVANTYDSSDGNVPSRVWWSANGDPTSWPSPGSSAAQAAQSDYNDNFGPQGEVTGLAPNLAGCDCAVFFAHGVQRMVYVGPPDIFDFFPAENVRGCRAPNSIVTMGALVYYLAEDGFYAFDGSASTPIGLNKVDKWFFSQVNQSYLWNIIGAADVINKAIVWIYPSTASPSGLPDSALIYRWDIQRWSPATLNADWITRLLSFGATLDSLSSLGFTDLDTIPVSLDSRAWIGGALQLAGVDSSHNLAFFNGTNLAAQIATKAMQIFPDKRAFVQGVRPLVDASDPTIAMSARVNYSDAEVFGAEVSPDVSGQCSFRSEGRYHRARLSVPAAGSWAQALGVDMTAIPSGTR